MLRSLLYILAGVVVFSIVLGIGSVLFRGKEYTIEELYAETMTRMPDQPLLTLAKLSLSVDGERTAISDFVELMNSDSESFEPAINRIRSNWHPGDTVMLIELSPFIEHFFQGYVRKTIEEATGKKFGDDQEASYKWVWSQRDLIHPRYPEFKALLYKQVDDRFATFFSPDHESLIPFNEVRWGGVQLDGIPPLNNPTTGTATDTTFLSDNDVVFGIEVGGEARAYPQQILAWHELVNDEVGGVPISGVYCTLCGSMIVYRSMLGGSLHTFGTSGFLFRSNKLMYDKETFSMWSALDGTPVVGPLVGKDIRLDREAVVTTTWGQWKKLHPATSVMTRRTGHRRDYREGTAYRDYYATDELMFSVPTTDTRLKNKAEVFVVDRVENDADSSPVAYSVDFLMKNPVYLAGSSVTPVVVLTDSTGANRAYQSQGVTFTRLEGDTIAIDHQGRSWTVTERKLTLNQPSLDTNPAIAETTSSDAAKQTATANELDRLPAHRAFWFGWHAAHPDTQLVL